MIKLIKNGTVITMNNEKLIDNLDIVIDNDSIIKIEKNYDGEYDEIIDAKNMVVMPGLINTHMHLGMSIFRNTNDGLDLMHWLNDKIFPIEDAMNDNDMYYSTLLTCIEMIKTGTTCGADMYFGWKEVLKAIKKSKIRCLYSRCINDPDGNMNGRINDFIELYNELNTNPSPLISLSVTPHSLYTCSKECLIKCKELADQYNLPIHIHFCENKDEVKTIENKFNMKPIKVLEDLGYLENKLILAHAVHLEDENISLLKRDNIYISHNILSNLCLGCGILPYKKYKDNGLNISFGSDGQGSGLNVDLFNSMQLTSLISKGLLEDPLATNSYNILECATINGAKALGLDKIIGSIEVGKKADIIILDLNNIEIYPTNNLIAQVVHNVKPSNIKYTIINGEILLKDGNLILDINEEELISKLNGIIERLNLNKKNSHNDYFLN